MGSAGPPGRRKYSAANTAAGVSSAASTAEASMASRTAFCSPAQPSTSPDRLTPSARHATCIVRIRFPSL